MKLYMPTRLYTGRGCVKAHAAEIAALGKNCLVVTGRSSAVKSGALADAVSVLEENGIRYSVFDGISSNPTVSSCIKAAQSFENADFVWGIGGGSPLDAAKAISVFCANKGLDEDMFYAKNWQNAPLPIVLSGTTAGTGSEVTSVSVLTDKALKKHSIHDDRLYARIAFGDYAYTLSQPEKVTLSTGIDILMHCVESFLSKKADELSMSCAARGIKLVCDYLSPAPDEVAREKLYEASILGGLAINTTGTCFPHNVGYYLTENYGVPHGIACAAFLEEIISYCRSSAPERITLMEQMSLSSTEKLLEVQKTALAGFELTLTDAEIEAALPRWENNGSVKNTLGNVTQADIRGFLSKFIL